MAFMERLRGRYSDGRMAFAAILRCTHPVVKRFRAWFSGTDAPRSDAEPSLLESNLFWNSLTFPTALVLAFIGARTQDSRWLLFGAFPFGCLFAYGLGRCIRVRGRRWTSILAGCLVVAGILTLVDKTAKPPSAGSTIADSGHQLPPNEPKPEPAPPPIHPRGSPSPKPKSSPDSGKHDPPPRVTDISLDVTHAADPSITVINSGQEILRDPRYSLALFDLDRASWDKGVLPTLRTTPPIFTPNDWLRPGNGFGVYPIFESNKPAPGTRVFGWARCDCPACAGEKFYLIYLVFEQEGWYYEIPGGKSVNMEFFKGIFGKTKEEQESLLLTGIPAPLRKPLTLP
jgi:hypothetical protein